MVCLSFDECAPTPAERAPPIVQVGRPSTSPQRMGTVRWSRRCWRPARRWTCRTTMVRSERRGFRLSLFGAGVCFVHALLRACTGHACISACIDAHGRIYSLLWFIKWFGCWRWCDRAHIMYDSKNRNLTEYDGDGGVSLECALFCFKLKCHNALQRRCIVTIFDKRITFSL
jgi:hypothetical protein